LVDRGGPDAGWQAGLTWPVTPAGLIWETIVDTWKEFDQNVVTHSAAHHLMAIDELIQKFGYARVSDVARVLNITRGSVSISLQPLKRAGLVVQDANRHLRLSRQGQSLVDAIKTKRLLMKRLLADVLGVSPEQAEIDACKMEHLISNQTARALINLLRFFDSDHHRARQFFEAWREFNATCEHEPGLCPSCESGCLAETVHD
jgi:Mn-dependent DtxR family transcriptional regulator